jgi:hypothetical protein
MTPLELVLNHVLNEPEKPVVLEPEVGYEPNAATGT